MVATLYFIRQKSYQKELHIATSLLHDREDLIQKAVGWMLREIGKRNLATEKTFLDQHAATMPRTALRYAIEKFPPETRKYYMTLKKRKEGISRLIFAAIHCGQCASRRQ
jgi:3-methyladenine DNA glycosylase AlkD